MSISLTVDLQAQAAYIRLLDGTVAATEQVNDAILVDLDDVGVVVGIEVLSLSAEIPFTELRTTYHVHADAIEALRQVQPSVGGFMTLTQATEGVSAARQRESVTA